MTDQERIDSIKAIRADIQHIISKEGPKYKKAAILSQLESDLSRTLEALTSDYLPGYRTAMSTAPVYQQPVPPGSPPVDPVCQGPAPSAPGINTMLGTSLPGYHTAMSTRPVPPVHQDPQPSAPGLNTIQRPVVAAATQWQSAAAFPAHQNTYDSMDTRYARLISSARVTDPDRNGNVALYFNNADKAATAAWDLCKVLGLQQAPNIHHNPRINNNWYINMTKYRNTSELIQAIRNSHA